MAKKEVAEQQTAEENTDVQFFERLEQLLEKLVPPSKVTVETCEGESIELPGAIPARRQVKVFRMIRNLIEMDAVSNALLNASSGEMASIVNSIVALAVQDEVAEALGDIFDAAYPNVIASGDDAIDVFPIEEIVTALVPFSERFIRKIGGGMSVLARGAMDLNE